VGSGPGRWSAAAASRATASAGAAMVARRAYSLRPSGAGHRSEKAPSALSLVTRPSSAPPTSTRNTGVRPFSSATKNTARLSGAHAGSCGHSSRPASGSRPWPLSRSTSHRPTSMGRSGSPCQIRSHTASRPSGEQAIRPTDDPGSSSSTRRSPEATSIATSWERGLVTSPVSQPHTTVAPSGVTATSCSSRARPGAGVRGRPGAMRPSAGGGAEANSRGARGPR
jgi:hypothetical protein